MFKEKEYILCKETLDGKECDKCNVMIMLIYMPIFKLLF